MMIFRKLFKILWNFIDIVCFLLSLAAFNYAAFLFGGKPWLIIMTGISLCVVGVGTELISGNQRGGK